MTWKLRQLPKIAKTIKWQCCSNCSGTCFASVARVSLILWHRSRSDNNRQLKVWNTLIETEEEVGRELWMKSRIASHWHSCETSWNIKAFFGCRPLRRKCQKPSHSGQRCRIWHKGDQLIVNSRVGARKSQLQTQRKMTKAAGLWRFLTFKDLIPDSAPNVYTIKVALSAYSTSPHRGRNRLLRATTWLNLPHVIAVASVHHRNNWQLGFRKSSVFEPSAAVCYSHNLPKKINNANHATMSNAKGWNSAPASPWFCSQVESLATVWVSPVRPCWRPTWQPQETSRQHTKNTSYIELLTWISLYNLHKTIVPKASPGLQLDSTNARWSCHKMSRGWGSERSYPGFGCKASNKAACHTKSQYIDNILTIFDNYVRVIARESARCRGCAPLIHSQASQEPKAKPTSKSNFHIKTLSSWDQPRPLSWWHTCHHRIPGGWSWIAGHLLWQSCHTLGHVELVAQVEDWSRIRLWPCIGRTQAWQVWACLGSFSIHGLMRDEEPHTLVREDAIAAIAAIAANAVSPVARTASSAFIRLSGCSHWSWAGLGFGAVVRPWIHRIHFEDFVLDRHDWDQLFGNFLCTFPNILRKVFEFFDLTGTGL